jgi:ATP-dependent 26S proteasome regulatory subunit
MSEENDQVQNENEPVEAVTEESQSTEQQLQLADLKVGYVVGLTDDGNFVFDIFGKKKGLVEILGLHQHASLRVQVLYNQTQMSGDALVNEIGKALSVLNQKLDQIVQTVAPKKPDNNL